GEGESGFRAAASRATGLREIVPVGSASFESQITAASPELDAVVTHRDDVAIWLFSGGTTGRPKGVLQTHASYANTTECYGKQVLGLRRGDVTLSVPKLFFGYAMGSKLFFPFSLGASSLLFPEPFTPQP